jgi:PadR family transcriptional regulator, regulatory protein PadR
MIGGTPTTTRLFPARPAREISAEHAVLETARSELRRGFLMIAVLAALGTELHGYELAEVLAERGIEIERTTLYPLLRRLEAQGLLASEWRREGKRRKRFYRRTTDGGRILEELLVEWKRIDLSLNSFVRHPRYEAA